MLFVFLNLFLTLFFVAETVYVDRSQKVNEDGTNPIVANILMIAINMAFFTLFFATHESITPSLFSILIKICFLLEACLMVNVAFCFVYYAWKYTNTISMLVKIALYLFAVWFVFFHFKRIEFYMDDGIIVRCDYVFKGTAQKFFPWTWFTLYEIVFKYIIPGFMSLVMLCRAEATATKLDRYKCSLYALALIAMWFIDILLHIATKYVPQFSFLRYFAYLPLLIIIPLGSRLQAAPSGRGTISFIVKGVFTYVIPACVMGIIFMTLLPLYESYKALFITLGLIAAGAILYFVLFINKVISKSKFGHSSDYAVQFEKDLASINYSGDMDSIADNMFQIFKNNVEASSMTVYIFGGNDTFEIAYSSTGRNHKLEKKGYLFEELLNLKRNIVVASQVESLHDFTDIRDDLTKFFTETDSDALFILNEGRDVHGLILLGLKTSKEHYKEYDFEVFTKMYSYFFVFGYFMRNISNKEIIGTVNRELRMSSQIITSIQENIDILNNPKMDAGCIMVPAHNIGGEFVDMVRLTDTRHMFIVGDLSGKGIAASMSMVILKAIIRAYLAETHDFKQLVVKVNRFIRDNLQKGTIFSGMFAIMNFENDTLYYINCGIPSILLYTEAYNNVIEIQGEGHILGFVKDISPYISVKQIKLNKNDIVLATTEGLIESHSLRGEKFGKDRIQRYMVANAMYPANRMAQFEYDELMKFMSHEMEEDVTVLVLKYLQSEASIKAEAEAQKIKDEMAAFEASIAKKDEDAPLTPEA